MSWDSDWPDCEYVSHNYVCSFVVGCLILSDLWLYLVLFFGMCARAFVCVFVCGGGLLLLLCFSGNIKHISKVSVGFQKL